MLGGFFICLFCFCSATFQAKKKLELKIVRRKKYIQATARLNQSLNRGGVQMKDLYRIPCLRSSSVSSFKTFFGFQLKWTVQIFITIIILTENHTRFVPFFFFLNKFFEVYFLLIIRT